jgi:hypothetical protein
LRREWPDIQWFTLADWQEMFTAEAQAANAKNQKTYNRLTLLVLTRAIGPRPELTKKEKALGLSHSGTKWGAFGVPRYLDPGTPDWQHALTQLRVELSQYRAKKES